MYEWNNGRMNLIGVADVVIGQRVTANGGVVGNNDESNKADDQMQNEKCWQVQENGSITKKTECTILYHLNVIRRC